MADLVSVIIPCYNRQAFIREAIESALGQTYDAVEVIVVDDGSTDDSWSIISSFGDAVRAVRIANGGAGRARNHGIAMARGEYLKFLDSDDLLPRGALAQMIEAAHGLSGNSFVVGYLTFTNAEGKPLANNEYKYQGLEFGREIPRSILLTQTTSVSMPLFPRKAVNDVGGFNEEITLAEDYEIMLRLYCAGYRPVYVSIQAALVRTHDLGRITTTLQPAAFEQAQVMFRDIIARFSSGSISVMSDEERIGMGRLIWGLARRAARYGYTDEATRLFQHAYGLAGSKAYVAGRRSMRVLYQLVSPVQAERLAGIANKYLLARGK